LDTKKRSARREPLTPGRIIDAAFRVIERDSLEEFSTRKLAQELRCEAMSIYHYFPSKAHLTDALVDRFAEEFDLLGPETHWRDRITRLVAEWRRLAMARPEFFRFFALHRLNTAGGLKFLDRMLAIYFDAGFDAEAAARLFRLLGYYVIGGLLDETSGYARGPSAVEPPSDETVERLYPRIVAVAPYFRKGTFEPTFDLGLAFILDASERILAETTSGKAARQE
jgi:AcrR family transcriptional regulator